MAGFGPPPKPKDRKVGHTVDRNPQTTLEFRRGEQPVLPVMRPGGKEWPEQTVRWWQMWRESAQAELMTDGDWSFLLDTALLHARIWGEDEVSVYPELRLRVSKFGQTIEDRLRLRITFADADEKDSKRPAGSTAKETYGAKIRALRPVQTPDSKAG